MKVTLGRVVHYVEARGSRHAGEARAAIVHGVHSDTVDLTVFGPAYAAPRPVCEVPFGGPEVLGSWFWPPRDPCPNLLKPESLSEEGKAV